MWSQDGRDPRLFAFDSAASNLTPGDTNGTRDVFVLKRKAGQGNLGGDLVRASVNSAGQAANGPSIKPALDGQGDKRRPHQGFRFEYKRGFVKLGSQKLVSSTPSGAPGNGSSNNPDMDDLGRYVAFESTASHLCGDCTGVNGDRNGAESDVFGRTISRESPTKDRMQMVSYSQGCSASNPSAKTVDQQGNGGSHDPVMTGAGENIVFDSEADNLKESAGIRQGDPNGHVRDIFYWNFPRGRKCGNVSRESRSDADRGGGQPLDGDSYNPALSQRANYIGFTSALTRHFEESSGATIGDVFERFLGGQ